jgi:HD superfamily phosphodiesterase
MMNTDTAKAIAREREEYMRGFVDEFFNEWEGIK